ncbi:MAG: endolytic transglycosylase MltG [Candidatus Gottesmanbacteria bacterium]
MNKLAAKFLRVVISVIVIIAALFYFFGPIDKTSETKVFIVPQNVEGFTVSTKLKEQNFIRNEWIINLMISGKTIEPGGYRLQKTMWAWQIARSVTSKPDLLWVTIIGCQRREQIGELLAKKLEWNEETLRNWNEAYKSLQPEYIEGVYYPDTYLIPRDETGVQVAKRFINRFNEQFVPYFQKFQDANIRWVTALKIASLIEREAAGPHDMKLIAGIIWNRLDAGMRLQIDATMQYTKGKKSDGSWWGGIDLTEKTSDSSYNTYLYKGLPPTPICSPSIAAIDSVLNFEETKCLFYLHDSQKQIHCAETYEEHKANIEEYLK